MLWGATLSFQILFIVHDYGLRLLDTVDLAESG